MSDHFEFHWGGNKVCHGYIVRCGSEGCQKTSMHLSFQELRQYNRNGYYESRFADGIDIDTGLFFSQPTSYFILDNRIPEKVRELIYEAENSRKSNFLVGASACLRKAVYELLEYEKAIASVLEDIKRLNDLSNRLLSLAQASSEGLENSFAKIYMKNKL